MNILNNPSVVGKTPLVCALLFESASVGQMWRMMHEHTSAGQNPWSWLAVTAGLALFVNFYRVCCPTQKFALWSAVMSATLNVAGLATVLYYR